MERADGQEGLGIGVLIVVGRDQTAGVFEHGLIEGAGEVPVATDTAHTRFQHRKRSVPHRFPRIGRRLP
ncbi:hypothetical protein GCM10017559_20710 [Streptosporangium longisporum]|uniref:Uncharacterized protein n=1 Tax=Streptosporangium longisporum TaxID=46187 RepID=A0ABN3XV74_9ACTN